MITILLLLQLVRFTWPGHAWDVRKPDARAEDLALEAFEPFLRQFTKSRSFQKKRTLFPVMQWEIELEPEDSTLLKVERRNWEWLRFDREGLLLPVGGESVAHTLRGAGSGMRLEVRGTDSGIATDYLFERRVGKWYLVAVYFY